MDVEFQQRLLLDRGAIDRLGEVVRELGGRQVLLVTDRHLDEIGHLQRARQALADADIETAVFEDVSENPTSDQVEAAAEWARQEGPFDLLVALGGGSPMDLCKGINFLLTNGGRIADYRGHSEVSHPLLPAVAVPTTAGTGSDAQSYAVIADARTHIKMACGTESALFRGVILDPDLTLTLPPDVTAVTGIDAITHAVESHVCTRRSPVSQLFSREAWRHLSISFPRVLRDPQDLAARRGMMWGAYLAGASIEKSMLGAAHACANPLTAHYEIRHGQAVGALLPAVIRFNSDVAANDYADLVSSNGLAGSANPALRLAETFNSLLKQAGLQNRLRDLGVDKSEIVEMSQQASRQWTGQFNPRPLEVEDFAGIYRDAW